MKKVFILMGFAAILTILQLSCSSNSYVDVGLNIGDDDLIGDVSNGSAYVGASIDSYGEWVATGSQGIAFGSGNQVDFNIIPMNTGSVDSDRAIALNDNGNFIAAFENGIYFGDISGALTKVYDNVNGTFISVAINSNDTWLVSSEDGVYIGSGATEPLFLDYVNNVGEFSHCSLNEYDEFVAAGSLQVLYGYIDDQNVVQLTSYDPVSVSNDSVWTDINGYGDFVATGGINTLLGLTNGTKNITPKLARKASAKTVNVAGSDVPVVVPQTPKNAKYTVNRQYKAWFQTHKTRKKVLKAAAVYHSCAINNYTDYVASGDDYLIYNDDQSFNPVTAPGEMVVVDINDSGDWIAVGTDGIFLNNIFQYDGMGLGDFLTAKMSEEGNFIVCTSYSTYHYNAATGYLIDDGPVADRGYPVAADIYGPRWIAVGNYGVLLWNY
ncbi:MAG: hypothetical protein GXO70_05695 [Acidobacteria bacterium]|nr:hypothetical protein [Acidobacteriota bacterium]